MGGWKCREWGLKAVKRGKDCEKGPLEKGVMKWNCLYQVL